MEQKISETDQLSDSHVQYLLQQVQERDKEINAIQYKINELEAVLASQRSH